MVDIHNYIEEQKELYAHLKRTASSYNSKPMKTHGFAQSILEEIEATFAQFKNGNSQLCAIVRENTISTETIPYFEEDIYYKFQDDFFSLKGQLLDLMEASSAHSPGIQSSTFAGPSHTRNETFSTQARLPKIDLPVFSGNYLSWMSYQDMFVSLVHNNLGLSDVQKYYFLKGSCTGTPWDIVNEYPATDSSYALAWTALHNRYHNKRKIVDEIFKKLFSIPSSDGSSKSIQSILDTTRTSIALLRTLEINTSGEHAMLIYMTVNRLDIQTRKEWEQSLKASTEIPPIEDLFNFLETTFRTLETISDHAESSSASVRGPRSQQEQQHNKSRTHCRRYVNTTSTNTDTNCPCCNKRHLLFKCFKFAALPSADKRDFLNSKRVCRNCLTIGHFSNNCRVSSRCQICQQNHHTIVHNEYCTTNSSATSAPQPVVNSNTTSTSQEIQNIAAHVVGNSMHGQIRQQVLLATMRVILKTPRGDFVLRALLDQCSQATFITQDAVDALKLSFKRTYLQVNGAGDQTSISKKYVRLTLFSKTESDFRMDCQAYVLPKITSYQPLDIDTTTLPNLEPYSLADPYFSKPGKIDLLLGGDVYSKIVLPQEKKFSNGLFLKNTHFGWAVSGPTSAILNQHIINVNVCSLDQQLQLFWEQEELLEKRVLTEEEELCEQHFKMTTSRDLTGRYTVSLPFKSLLKGGPLPVFSHTDYSALSRLKNVESKCNLNASFGKLYTEFMEEYEHLGHMKKVGTYPQDLSRNGFFLPHHGVFRESSSTTKLRVVFDGSCKRPPQPSLNEELAAGPALQNDLPTIITRWRRFKVGFRADLEKMFRQILVKQEQQKFQQILWRSSESKDISIYNLCTVTYGTTPAPFLSIRVLQQLAMDEKEKYPLACSVLNSDTYVDDVISGADSISEAYDLHCQLCKLLSEGKFNLRKWTTNSKELLERIPVEFRENSCIFELDQPNTVKALGLEWNTIDDCFSFKIHFDNTKVVVTKRSLLSDAAKLYDPLGWLAPTTILAKIEFQNLWLLGIEWNDSLPENLQKRWLNYRDNLKILESIKIPRWIGVNKNVTIEIHGFSDSSKLAYAAVVYAKTTSVDSGTKVYLLQSKTKVGPIKRLTIPRMELCGATLLVKLVDKITSSLDQKVSNIFYWTDSTTVLSWIRGQSSRWPVYVGNRVAEIQRRSHTAQWRHISTRDNPADCASRGISSEELMQHDLWWSGPKWLTESQEKWPKQPKINLVDIEEGSIEPCLNIHSTFVDAKVYPDLISRFSTLSKLLRVTAYIIRFKNNTLYNKHSQINGNGKMTGFLSTDELKFALLKLIKLSQEVDFSKELFELKEKGQVLTNSALAQLCPFLDASQILRVGGRIQHSDLNYCSKHPILLRKQNPLSNLLFLDAHVKTLHGGLLQMQAYVARQYWILSGRNIAKRVLRKCTNCFKYNAKAAQQIMGNLPSIRLKPARPFKHSGVDYAGPITIKQSTARNSVTTKGYICLFICMVTKAIHLEAVTNLSTEAFLAAFRRFVSRRGPCTDLYSDCGTNFVGANKELQILYNRNKSSIPNEILNQLASNSTRWHFIPPASPNFGGLWEAGVKSTKHHLRRVMQNRILTFEELITLLAQIECCLNSRPLCPLSSDPSDCNALTPAHFLIGEPTLCVPEEDLLDANIDRLSRWKVVEKLKQHFWRRWSDEWLCRLQARPKWLQITKNAEKGDLVIVFDERCAPGEWPLARIQDIHPGKDGCVRVVTLFSNGKTFKRPISKIAFLPINDRFDEPNCKEMHPNSNEEQLV